MNVVFHFSWILIVSSNVLDAQADDESRMAAATMSTQLPARNHGDGEGDTASQVHKHCKFHDFLFYQSKDQDTSSAIVRVIYSDKKGNIKSLTRQTKSKLRKKPKKTSARLTRPRVKAAAKLRKKKRRGKQSALEVIPVNEVSNVLGDYEYDYVDYIYDYDDIAPVVAPAPPPVPPPHPPAPPADVVIPVYGLHDHDDYKAAPVLLHDHPKPHDHYHHKSHHDHHNPYHHKSKGYHVSVDTPSFSYNIEQYGEPHHAEHGYHPPPPPPPQYDHYPAPQPKYYQPAPPPHDYHPPPPQHNPYAHHGEVYRPKFGYPKPIPHIPYQEDPYRYPVPPPPPPPSEPVLPPHYRSYEEQSYIKHYSPPPPHHYSHHKKPHHSYHPYPLDEVTYPDPYQSVPIYHGPPPPPPPPPASDAITIKGSFDHPF